jgi:hypothetical protein
MGVTHDSLAVQAFMNSTVENRGLGLATATNLGDLLPALRAAHPGRSCASVANLLG